MNTGHDRGGFHPLLGAYVLGGLDAREQEEFETHAAACGACARELEELRGLPVLLDRVPPADAEALSSASVAGTERLLERVRRARMDRRRWAFALAAGLLVLGAAGGVGVGASVVPEAPPPSSDAARTVALESSQGVAAEVDLLRRAWGTQVELRASDLPRDGVLSLWVVDFGGKAERAGAWSATPTGKSSVIGAVPWQVQGIGAVQVRDSSGTVLASAAWTGDA